MMTPRQLDLVTDTALRHDPRLRIAAAPPRASPLTGFDAALALHRNAKGRFTPPPAAPSVSDAVASAVLAGYFASVCRMSGIDRDEARRQLARPGKPNADRAWRAAAYARQLAMYLALTEANVSQAQLGRITGLDRSAAWRAVRAIEDLRERPDYEDLIHRVLVDVAMNGLNQHGGGL